MKIAGINFDHMHMGDLLRMVHEHPYSELVGICDEQPERMQMSIENFGLSEDKVFRDYRECLEKTQPDIVILCPATAEHADWTEKVAPFGVHILMEKPFAASLADADRMIAAMEKSGKQLAINWPLRWLPGNYTAHKLIEEGRIGKVTDNGWTTYDAWDVYVACVHGNNMKMALRAYGEQSGVNQRRFAASIENWMRK